MRLTGAVFFLIFERGQQLFAALVSQRDSDYAVSECMVIMRFNWEGGRQSCMSGFTVGS